jgi:hypothetical protein
MLRRLFAEGKPLDGIAPQLDDGLDAVRRRWVKASNGDEDQKGQSWHASDEDEVRVGFTSGRTASGSPR